MPIQPTQADLEDYKRRMALQNAPVPQPVYWGPDANAYSYERHVREEQAAQRKRELEVMAGRGGRSNDRGSARANRQGDIEALLARELEMEDWQPQSFGGAPQPQPQQGNAGMFSVPPGQVPPAGAPTLQQSDDDLEAAIAKRLGLPAAERDPSMMDVLPLDGSDQSDYDEQAARIRQYQYFAGKNKATNTANDPGQPGLEGYISRPRDRPPMPPMPRDYYPDAGVAEMYDNIGQAVPEPRTGFVGRGRGPFVESPEAHRASLKNMAKFFHKEGDGPQVPLGREEHAAALGAVRLAVEKNRKATEEKLRSEGAPDWLFSSDTQPPAPQSQGNAGVFSVPPGQAEAEAAHEARFWADAGEPNPGYLAVPAKPPGSNEEANVTRLWNESGMKVPDRQQPPQQGGQTHVMPGGAVMSGAAHGEAPAQQGNAGMFGAPQPVQNKASSVAAALGGSIDDPNASTSFVPNKKKPAARQTFGLMGGGLPSATAGGAAAGGALSGGLKPKKEPGDLMSSLSGNGTLNTMEELQAAIADPRRTVDFSQPGPLSEQLISLAGVSPEEKLENQHTGLMGSLMGKQGRNEDARVGRERRHLRKTDEDVFNSIERNKESRNSSIDTLSPMNGRLGALQAANERARNKEQAENSANREAFLGRNDTPVFRGYDYPLTQKGEMDRKAATRSVAPRVAREGVTAMRRQDVKDRETARKDAVRGAMAAALSGQEYVPTSTGNAKTDSYANEAGSKMFARGQQQASQNKLQEALAGGVDPRLIQADLESGGKFGVIDGIMRGQIQDRQNKFATNASEKLRADTLADYEKKRQDNLADSLAGNTRQDSKDERSRQDALKKELRGFTQQEKLVKLGKDDPTFSSDPLVQSLSGRIEGLANELKLPGQLEAESAKTRVELKALNKEKNDRLETLGGGPKKTKLTGESRLSATAKATLEESLAGVTTPREAGTLIRNAVTAGVISEAEAAAYADDFGQKTGKLNEDAIRYSGWGGPFLWGGDQIFGR